MLEMLVPETQLVRSARQHVSVSKPLKEPHADQSAKTIRTQETARLTKSRQAIGTENLFTSLVNNCQNCRTAFTLWDIEENLHGVSPHRERLASAMQKCRQAVENALSDPRLEGRQKLIRSYLNHIDRRITLLDVAMTKTWGDYERKKQEFLEKALSVHSRT
jgi:hypothetical protein